MKQTAQSLTAGVVTVILSLSVCGCDLINPPKKETKKTTAAQTQAASPTAATGALPANVLVRIGNWTLTQEQFEQRLKLLKEGMPNFDENKPGNKEAVLDELIRQQVLVKDAEESGIGNQKEVTEAVEDFRRTLLVQELANRLTKEISATEKDAKEYYDQNKAIFVDPIEWKVREIVTADEATANSILVQVLQGGDFAEIAKAQSKGKTAPAGGLLPTFSKAPFAAMQAAISGLDTGGKSAVFKGPEGYYIVKVDEKKGGSPKSYESVKKDLIAGLTLQKQQEAIMTRISQVAKKLNVEINKELIGSNAAK